MSLKILNGILSDNIDEEERKRLITVKTLYIIYLIVFYSTITCAIIKVYIAATTGK